MSVLPQYLLALGATIAIETPIAWLMLRKVCPARRILLWAVLGNILTHVSMHFLLPHLGLSRVGWELAGEAQALAVEAVIYAIVIRPHTPWLAIATSAACNGVSYALGFLLFP